jgi:hypothetical protein
MSVAQTTVGLGFSESIVAFLPQVECREALDEREREEIYRLRYAAYQAEGALPPGAPEIFKDKYDDTPNGKTFGIYVEGRLASSIRMHVASLDSPDCPGMSVFSDYLKPVISAGMVVIDPTRFVVDGVAARLYPKLPYATVRICWMAAEHFGADIVLATVRTEHQAFYKRIFGHKVACDARPYPSLSKPISLMVLDFRKERDRIINRYPFFHYAQSEREQIFGASLDADSALNPVGSPKAKTMLREDLAISA